MDIAKLQARFWPKVEKTESCWLWTAAKDSCGYGILMMTDTANGIRGARRAHRLAWLMRHGSWPTLQVLHRCDVRACVNPDHLFLGTQLDNIADMKAKGRRKGKGSQPGEENGQARLTADQVREIRSKYAAGGCTCYDLAAQYGISFGHVNDVVNRKRWAHVW